MEIGDKAYLDSFTGMIKCRIVGRVIADSGSVRSITVLITARKSRCYRHGEILDAGPSQVVARNKVRFRKYGTRILA